MVDRSTLAAAAGSVPANLGLVAGPVTITGGSLRAPSGTIQVTGVAGAGEVPVDPRNTAGLTVTSFAPVEIKSSGSTRSLLTASSLPGPSSGGSVFIRSGALTIDASTIAANNNGSGPGGQIVLRGDNQVTLSNGTSVQAFTSGSGSGAGVTISTAPAGMIRVDASTVSSLTSSTASNAGPGQRISIVTGEIALHNGANLLAGSCAITAAATCNASGAAAGAGGGVFVSVGGSATIDSGSTLGTLARGTGNAGNVFLNVAGQLTIDGSNPSLFTGISSNIGFITAVDEDILAVSRGVPGNITVGAGSLSVANGGAISAGTFGTSKGGSVFITVAGQITIAGTSGITSESVSTGNAGNVSVNSGTLTIFGNGVISAATLGPGSGGSVTVGVAGGLSIDGTGGNRGLLTGISSQATAGSTGNAGSVSVTAGNLVIGSGGSISTNANGSGAGGSVSVATTGALLLDGQGVGNTQIVASATGLRSGPSGSVTVAANALTVRGGAKSPAPPLDPAKAETSP